MKLAEWVPILTIVVTTIGVGVAVWNAVSAKRQAQIARHSANAALLQAEAAAEQVELLREQTLMQRSTQDRLDQPTFSIREARVPVVGYISSEGETSQFVPASKDPSAPLREWVVRRSLDITMNEGPAKITAEVGICPPNEEVVHLPFSHRFRLSRSATLNVVVYHRYHAVAGEMDVVINSEEANHATIRSPRQWTTRQRITLL